MLKSTTSKFLLGLAIASSLTAPVLAQSITGDPLLDHSMRDRINESRRQQAQSFERQMEFEAQQQDRQADSIRTAGVGFGALVLVGVGGAILFRYKKKSNSTQKTESSAEETSS